MSARLKAYLYLLLATAIWASAGPVIKYTLNGIAPLTFLTYRFAISAAIAVPFFLSGKSKFPTSLKTWLLVFLYGVVSTSLGLSLLFIGLASSTVLDLTIIEAASPLITALAGGYFLREHITHRERIGISIALAGTSITLAAPLLLGTVEDTRFSGNLLILAFVIVDTYSFIVSKQLVRRGVDSLSLTNAAFIVGFLTTAPVAVALYGADNVVQSIVWLPPQFHLGVAYMAILSGTVAYFLWTRGQKTIEVSEAAVFRYLYPLFAAPLAIFWLGESITTYFIVGAVLIAIGVVFAEYKTSFRKSPHKKPR